MILVSLSTSREERLKKAIAAQRQRDLKYAEWHPFFAIVPRWDIYGRKLLWGRIRRLNRVLYYRGRYIHSHWEFLPRESV